MTLATLQSFRSKLGGLIAGKGWRESFARGDDVGGMTPAQGGCPNPAVKSAWVFRCLQLISGQVRMLPLSFYTHGQTGKQIPWTDKDTLEFWQRPAETPSGRLAIGDFIELSLHWINLTGQACWILDDTWLTPGGVKSPILLARTDRLSPIKKGDLLLGWMFTDGSGGRHVLVPQQVIRPRLLNPFDDAAGLSPLEAARMAVDADYAAGVFARNVAASNGDQGVYIIAKGGAALSDEQQAQIVAQLRQKADSSRRGQYRPAFLTADVAVEDPKIKTVDAAFVTGRQESRHEIFVAFGVPPSMSDRMDSYSVGAASDRYRLIEETCMPHSMRICQAIAEVERLRSGRVLTVEQEWSEHPVLAQVRIERAKSAAEMWKTGVPWQVLNQVHDLRMPAFAGWESAWLPMSLERVEDSNPKTQDEKETQADGEDETADSKKALATSHHAIQELRTLMKALPVQKTCNGPANCGCGGQHKATDEGERDPERVKLWEKHMKARAPSEKLMLSKLRKVIMAARQETLAKLDESAKALDGVRERGLLDIIFDSSNFQISMVEQTKPVLQDTLKQSLMQFAEEIGSDDPWEMEGQTTLNFLAKRENRIRDAARGIHDEIKRELDQGLQAGETNAELADRVRRAFNGISKDRAETIAATEITAAYGYARHDAMGGLGIDRKQWLSAQDGRVRDTHMRADGQEVGMDEPFIVELKDGGSEELMYPGDEKGSAENVIRCRCVELAVMG